MTIGEVVIIDEEISGKSLYIEVTAGKLRHLVFVALLIDVPSEILLALPFALIGILETINIIVSQLIDVNLSGFLIIAICELEILVECAMLTNSC